MTNLAIQLLRVFVVLPVWTDPLNEHCMLSNQLTAENQI